MKRLGIVVRNERLVLYLPKTFDFPKWALTAADALYDLDDRTRLKERSCDTSVPLTDEDIAAFDSARDITPTNLDKAFVEALLHAELVEASRGSSNVGTKPASA